MISIEKEEKYKCHFQKTFYGAELLPQIKLKVRMMKMEKDYQSLILQLLVV